MNHLESLTKDAYHSAELALELLNAAECVGNYQAALKWSEIYYGHRDRGDSYMLQSNNNQEG